MMTLRTITRNVSTIVLAVALVTGCSAIADKASEKVAEKGLEAAGGGEVDIDTGGDGKVTIESDEGSLEIGGGELPDGFPKDVPLPDGFTVVAAMSMGQAGAQSFTLRLTSADADPEQTHDGLKGRSQGAGFEILSTRSMSAEEAEMRFFTMSNDVWDVNVIVTGEPDLTSVNYTVAPSEGSQ